MKNVNKPKFNNLESVFELGYGKVHLGYFVMSSNDDKRCGISLTNSNDTFDIGQDTTHLKHVEETNCFIFIDNLEGLEVLQDRVNKCREFLKNK